MKRIDADNICLASEISMMDSIDSYYRDLQRVLSAATSRYSQISSFTQHYMKMNCSKKGNRFHYLRKAPGDSKYTYLGTKDNKTVIKIQEAYYFRKYIDAIRNNLKLIEEFKEKIESVSFQSIT